MNDMSSTPGSASATAHRAFPAFRYRGFQIQFTTYVLAMMADNIERVISYWMLYQKFHSPALAGFAVLSHWLPFLMFSVAAGALADRFDPRRLIQCGMGLFILASLGWGYFFITGTLEVWHAMVLLVIHGCAGVLWQTPNQLLLYDIVGPADLMSAVRLNATARYVGVLVGPAMGGFIMLSLGPSHGILLGAVAGECALRAALPQGRTPAASRRAWLFRHRSHHPRYRRASGHHINDPACGPLIVLCRQCL